MYNLQSAEEKRNEVSALIGLQYGLPEGSREVGHAGSEQHLREEVGAARDDLPLQVPTVDAAAAGVARARHDVVVVLSLQLDELGDELGLQSGSRTSP